jgi:hypothetical protein
LQTNSPTIGYDLGRCIERRCLGELSPTRQNSYGTAERRISRVDGLDGRKVSPVHRATFPCNGRIA